MDGLVDYNNDDNDNHNHHQHEREEASSSGFILRIVVFRTILLTNLTPLPLEIVTATMLATAVFITGMTGLLLTRSFIQRVPPLMTSGLLCPSPVSWMTNGPLGRSLVSWVGARLTMTFGRMGGRGNDQRRRRPLPRRGARTLAAEIGVCARHVSLRGGRRGGLPLFCGLGIVF